MDAQAIISADSHFVEPPEMWVERVDHRFRDRAPHLEKRADGPGSVLVCGDMAPTNGAGYLAAGVDPSELAAFMQVGYDAAPAYMRDPAARVAAQDRDGLQAEVLYSSYGMALFHLGDDELRDACFRAFNDWAAEYCSHDPSRLIGIGLVALDDVTTAVGELERIAGAGLRGAMIWAEPPEGLPYSSDHFDPFWRAAEALDMKLSLHSLTSKRTNFDAGSSGLIYRSIVLYQEVVRTITDLIVNGVLERHPELRFISAENEIGWLPFHLWRMDQLYEKLRSISGADLSMAPSDYFARQVYATFIEDPFPATTVPAIGAKNVMWSSDFPHLASSFPQSREVIAKNLGELEDRDLVAIVHDNVARLYGI